jgi:uncharacterized protein (DUF2141 family)
MRGAPDRCASIGAVRAVVHGHEGPLKLYVDVEGVRSNDGLIAVTLYADDSSRFLRHRGSLYVGRVPAKAGKTRVCIYLPSAGTYALAVYHDANAGPEIRPHGDRPARRGFRVFEQPGGVSRHAPLQLGAPCCGAHRPEHEHQAALSVSSGQATRRSASASIAGLSTSIQRASPTSTVPACLRPPGAASPRRGCR